MILVDEHIVEFQMLWKKHFGTDITKAQALEKGLRVIRLIEAVSRTLADDARNDLPPPVGFLEKHRQQ